MTAAGAAAVMIERLEQLAWWRDEVSPRVEPHEQVDVATATIVAESRALRHRPLGELLPDLPARCKGEPSQHLESVRAWNIVRRCSPNTWSELAGCSAERIGTWPNAGRKVVVEIIAAAVRAWAQAEAVDVPVLESGAIDRQRLAELVDELGTAAATPSQTINAPTSSPVQLPAAASLRRAQELLIELASESYRQGAENLGEALRLAATSNGAGAWQNLARLRLDDLLGLSDGLEAAWERLLSFDERERRILEARTFARGRPLTLGELGEELGVTRERIRQLESRSRGEIERLAAERACLPVVHLAARVRGQLGSLVGEEAVEAALRAAVPDASDAQLRRAVLLYLAGPYRYTDGFWQRANELQDLIAALRERADEPWSDDEVDRLLRSVEVAEEHREACVAALPLRRFDERHLVWTGSMADKAARVLRVHGEPMSREQLHTAIGADANLRSLLGQVQGDPRFRRMGLDSYGLAEWGGEEYTGIADEIEQAIERRGGCAPLDEVVEELVEWFGVSPQSVRSYAASRRFLRQPDGMLAVAPEGHAGPAGSRMPPELDRDLVRRRSGWCVRVVVDRDVLRGSGRPVRTAIAQAAGVRPGEARALELRQGTAYISWRGNQPALGSTRLLVESLGCSDRDLLFLPLQDGEQAFAVAHATLLAAGGLSRVALELGLEQDADLSAIAAAIGLPDNAAAADIRARLRARGHADLERLLPERDDDDDQLIDQLIGLGE